LLRNEIPRAPAKDVPEIGYSFASPFADLLGEGWSGRKLASDYTKTACEQRKKEGNHMNAGSVAINF
jgi:hypothetical protein